MELNKNKINFNNNNNDYNYRESFDHICDDLCELIISYLSFEDKIRFECVSKQFQRLVYNKQNSIEINDRNSNELSLNNLLFYEQIDGEFNYKAFESLLKKCKFITKISIESRFESGDDLIELIAKYCHHLKHISIDFSNISHKSLVYFGLKCGQKLETIEFLIPKLENNKINSIKSLLKLCPNLLNLNQINIKAFDSLEPLFPKIQKIQRLFQTEIQYMESFVNQCQNSLKSLQTIVGICDNFRYQMNNNSDISESTQNIVVKHISNLKNLEELHLIFNCFESTPHLIKSIAIKCKNIKHLNLCVRTTTSFGSQLYKTIGYFENIRSLSLTGIEDKFNIKSLVNCSQLRTLKIERLDDKSCDGIETITPLLSHLFVGKDSQLSDKTFNSLAKLKNLKVINIYNIRYWPTLTDKGVCDVIENCPQIKSIQFKERPNLTQKTIEALIALAKRKPRTYFHHILGVSHNYFAHNKDSDYGSEEDMYLSEKLPKNLVIHFI
jgi:hypothetical protein